MKKKILFGLFGTGGFAREVMPIVKETFMREKSLEAASDVEFVFVESEPKLNRINDYKLISEREFLEIKYDKKYFNIAVANSRVRQNFTELFLSKGFIPLTVHSDDVTIYDNNLISEGSIICANSIITSNATIGKFFQSNIYSYVAHDCEIGDYVTFAPRVSCNGNIIIEDHAYIGTGAILKQGTPERPLKIGKGAVIGMGSVVTKDVSPNTTVIGNPARPLQK